MKKVYLLSIFLLALLLSKEGQSQKILQAHRINEKIEIDGIGDEAIWSQADIADEFIMDSPTFGKTPEQQTTVRILYDDIAIYVLAEMEEISRDSIMTQLSQRDNLGNTDGFGILLDTYGNGTDGVIFAVGATGVQVDALKENSGQEDGSWDAVWFSEVNLHDNGWTAEIMLPYSALRFPKKASQEWVLNFLRIQARNNTATTWNPIDPNKDGVFTQSGRLVNVHDIKPPVRLSFSPYFSAYAQHNHDNNNTPINSTGYTYNGGMDVKYGINDAFTLDMTLIPDFGQVESDDNIVNLSPFEVRFDEKRPFFTEGVELFNKAGIFYSRRIGSTPVNFNDADDNLASNEVIESNQRIPQLYNATKISGRNSNGLGIGVLNGVEASTNAIIRNTETNELREYQTQPLTNYNIFVVDQNLKNNSSISLINTNVWRKGKAYYDANVTGMEFSLKDNNQKYEISGTGAYSIQSYDSIQNNTGHKFGIDFEKIAGQLNYGFGYFEESPNYNPNDFGFLRAANERNIDAGVSYEIFQPFGAFNRAEFWGGLDYSRIIDPDAFTGWSFNTGLWMQTKGFWAFNMWANYGTTKYDYFEPRVQGRVLTRPPFYNTGINIQTDSRKKLALSTNSYIYNIEEEGRWGYNVSPRIRYRFNDKLEAYINMSADMQYDDTGWLETSSNQDIYIGQRDRLRIVNLTGFNYNFTEKIGLNLRVRHYWERGLYQSFHELAEDGDLLDTDYMRDLDYNYTFFNIDLNFNWRFAPGSDIFINWKNSIEGGDDRTLSNISDINYFNGINSHGQYPQNNSISVRIVYYLDYLNVKNWL